MAALCEHCDLQFDCDARLPKVLSCGHLACRSCIERHTPDGRGSKCPRCRKVSEVVIEQLVTFQMETKRLWCRDCDAEARAACLDEHTLCGLGRLRQELAAQVEPLLADCAASLRRLTEDVRAEERVLQQWRESLAGGRQDPTAIRAVAAAVRAHPLHGLLDGEGEESGLLLRALAALRREKELPGTEELRAREAAVDAKIAALEDKLAGMGLKDGTLDEKLDKLVALNEKEVAVVDGQDAEAAGGKKMKSSSLEKRKASVEAKEAAVEKREAAVKKHEAAMEKREAAVKKHEATMEKREAVLKKQETAAEKREAAVKKLEGDVEKREAAVKKLEGDVEKREAAVKKLEGDLEKRKTGVGDKEVDVEIRENVIGRRETTAEEREAAVDAREAAVSKKELAVQAREAAIQEREADVQEKDAALEERENAVEAREAALQEKEAALMEISASGETPPRLQERDASARGRERAATWQERSNGSGEETAAQQQRRQQRQTAKRGSRAANTSRPRRSRESPPLAHSSGLADSTGLLNSTQWTTCSESSSSSVGAGSPPPVWKPRYVAAKKSAAPFIPSSPSGSSDDSDDDDGAGARQRAPDGTQTSLAREQQNVAVRKRAALPSPPGGLDSNAGVGSEADRPLSDDELPDIDISSTAPQTPGLDSLPEGLLIRVLSLLPLWWPQPKPDGPSAAAAAASTAPPSPLKKCVPDLLSLRLVCRRWSRAALSPGVWRHRQLNLDVHPAGLLRLAPAVSKVSATTWKADAILQALEVSACQVRSLELRIVASTAASVILKRTLDKLRPSLRELDLTVLFNHHQNSASRLMPLLDGSLPALRALRLGQQPDLTGHHGPLNFPFRNVRGQLVSLAFGDNVHADTARSLLAANGESLREVDCGRDADLVPLVVAHAALVRTVSLQGPAVAAAAQLRTLEHLHTLKVAPDSEEQAMAVAELLAASPQASPLTPSEVHVRLQSLDQLRHWNERLDMRRVSVLDVSLDSGELQLPMFALILPAVVALTVDLGRSDDAWTKFKAAWSHSTAPKLAKLHLVNAEGCAYSGWAKELAAKRRSVVILVDK